MWSKELLKHTYILCIPEDLDYLFKFHAEINKHKQDLQQSFKYREKENKKVTATAARRQIIKYKFCIAWNIHFTRFKKSRTTYSDDYKDYGKINIFEVLQMSSYTKHFLCIY